MRDVDLELYKRKLLMQVCLQPRVFIVHSSFMALLVSSKSCVLPTVSIPIFPNVKPVSEE